MLSFPGHIGGGLIVAAVTGLNPLMVFIGSVIPDLDVLPYLFGVGYRKTHRTITHSVFMPVLLAFFSLPLAFGVLSHIFLDFLFYPGIKLFYPFVKRDYFLFKGDLVKHQTPEAFIKSIPQKKKYFAYDLLTFTIGLLLFNFR